MPCCQSLSRSQFHACHAARACDFPNFMRVLPPEPQAFSSSCMTCTEVKGKAGSILCFSMAINKCHCSDSICAVEDSTPRLPFRVAGTKGERLPVLEPEHLAQRRRRVPAPTSGTVSPTALARRSHRSLLRQISPCLHPHSPIYSFKRTHALLPEPEGSSSERMSCAEVQGPGKNGQHFVLLNG